MQTSSIKYCRDGWFTLRCRWAKSQGNAEPQPKLSDSKSYTPETHTADSQKKNTTYL